jgi:hypothetical protein
VRLNSKSIVLATLQTKVAGVQVQAAVPLLTGDFGDSFTIHLNRAPGSSGTPGSVRVGWFLVETP